jgi:hypothetical protein
VAKIWFPLDGNDERTPSGPYADLPLAKVIDPLRLEQRHYLGNDPQKFPFGDPNDHLNRVRGAQNVVVEVEDSEAGTTNWKAGFYHALMRPDEAMKRLVDLTCNAK